MNIAYHELMNGATLMIDPEPGRQRGLRDHPCRKTERMRHPRGRISKELLPPGTANAVGGLRDPQGRQRLLHSDHDRPGRVGRPVGRHAGRGCQLGQGQSRRPPRHRRRVLRFDDRLSAVLRICRRVAQRAPEAPRAGAPSGPAGGRPAERSERGKGQDVCAIDYRRTRDRSTDTGNGHALVRTRPARRAPGRGTARLCGCQHSARCGRLHARHAWMGRPLRARAR